MPVFAYKARDAAGKIADGTMEAPHKGIVADKLRQMGFHVVGISEQAAAAGGGVLEGDLLEKFQRVGTRDLVIFNNQLATMISSGMTLISSLNVLGQQIENKKLQQIILAVRDDVERGNPFSGALEKYPQAFSPLFVNMIRAGETGGAMDVILHRLAIFSEQAEEIRNNVKTAMTYPFVILVVSLSVILFLVMGVFPKFEAMFNSMNVPLPLPTQILLNLSHFLRSKWPVLLALIIGGGIGFFRYAATPAGRYVVDFSVLQVPVFGEILKKAAISRFARTLGTLVSSGVPLLQSLRIVETTVGNAAMAKIVVTVADSVNRGESMSAPLREAKLFPPMVGHMVSIGEESGTLDTILNKIADFYDSEVTSMVKRLSAVVEPIMLVFIGGMVGLIALSLFLPMFSLIKVMG
ncbi:MAG: type II secretion system F family protein [Candidatus Omnitrophica bacterium]|nr:type II secretion system F family protein [Candidatus Omnitrophota bacterium]